MDEHANSETMFSPRRWFLGDDGAIRPLWRSFLFIFLTVFLVLLTGQALMPIIEGLPPELKMGLYYAARTGVLLLLSWLFLAAVDRKPFRNLGLWFYRGTAKEFLIGFGIGGMLMGAVVLLMVASGALAYHELAFEGLSGLAVWALILFAASASEEIAFRGYGMQRLIDSVGEPAGVLGFSALFALLHMDNPHSTVLASVNTFLAGILLSLAYLKTRALWLPIGLHWSWNFLMGQVFSLPISGYNFAPRLFQAEVSGADWLTGGSYGPEGSILLTIVAILAIIWMGQTKAIAPSQAVEEGLE